MENFDLFAGPVPSTNCAEYLERCKVRGYNGKVNVFTAANFRDAAKLLHRQPREPEQHQLLSKLHKQAAEMCSSMWGLVADQAALEVFGRPFRVSDYRISGIACEEFNDVLKDWLRHFSHEYSRHMDLSHAHAYAGSKLIRRAA